MPDPSGQGRLDEVRLGRRFRVSRTPVREALQLQRGVFVRQPGAVELVEEFDVMAVLETVCARLAVARITDAAQRELHDTNAKRNAAVAARDADGNFRENERFHAILYRQSGNRFPEQICHRLHRRLRPFPRMQLRLRGAAQAVHGQTRGGRRGPLGGRRREGGLRHPGPCGRAGREVPFPDGLAQACRGADVRPLAQGHPPAPGGRGFGDGRVLRRPGTMA
ncbi:MAG: GntR family transcriptional regulator [Roseicyclus sp.]